ncbi:MAG TPA: PilT/PilU family type 4a pilus ATPase [Acidimicrobiia bacterium]|nr:PilT/PilU family type 4a pilus ATPase [Acidimicrobiia bacterium]
MTKVARRLGQMLVDQRLMTPDDLEGLSGRSEESGVHLARLIVESGLVHQADVLRTIAASLSLEYVDPSAELQVEDEAVGRLDAATARNLGVLPLRIHESGAVVVALADPLDDAHVESVRKALGGSIVPAMAPRRTLVDAIERVYAGADGAAPATGSAFVRDSAVNGTAAVSDDGDDEMHINELLVNLMDRGGSDLHLSAGSMPQGRINGHLQEMEGYPRLMPGPLRQMIYAILSSRHREQLEEHRELDVSHPLPGRGRFRVNVFFQRGSVGAVLRAIPNEIKTPEDLGMPPVALELAAMPRGLVLVTGATGSGKSTTLASMIDHINRTRPVHIMTVEDPIEFLHRHNRAIVNQREVGSDTESFSMALRAALRQDPDVILVGELRDLETMATALTAAETGHLVFATLHTQNAPQSVDRMIDVFPPHQQQQVRVQLAETLQGVITQQLVPTVDGAGRVPALEVMVATPAIRNLIREGKIHQIRSSIQAGGRHGMQTMDQALAVLVRTGKIDVAVAQERAQNPEEFANLVGRRS